MLPIHTPRFVKKQGLSKVADELEITPDHDERALLLDPG
jgi:hypothetical protein